MGFEPRHPGLAATACLSVWVAILSVPMLSGAFLATPLNDQYDSGYAYRAWAAEWWKDLGHIPLWNPEIFGGMPFVAGMHGDIFYPTAWLRLVFPIHVSMNLGFVIHYVLAGVFVYWFLRRWNVSWTGAVVGGLAYQLSGVVGSYVSPGHDGKLFVTAMLPLMLVGLTLSLRDRRWGGFGVVALAVGLIMLSPHPQMAQYALLAAGLFALYLTFGEPTARSSGSRLSALGLALVAVVVGLGISAVQYLPFAAYIPYSPRDEALAPTFAWSAAYAIPWAHLPELIIPRFTGESFNGSYWGPNGLKLHSEYLGLTVVTLAALGALDRGRRRFLVWLGGIAALFLLVALGSATPFYRLWWEVVPFASSTRAPGMALFVVALVVATFAAVGVDRLLGEAMPRFTTAALVMGGVTALLGLAGTVGGIAAAMGQAVELELGMAGRAAAAARGAGAIRLGAAAAGLALAAVGALALLRVRRAISTPVMALLLVALVGAELWLNARAFWNYSRAHEELFADDDIKRHLRTLRRPFRVWDVADPAQGIPPVYSGAALMADGVAQLYGHHGNELHSFDALNGRRGLTLSFDRAGHPRILELYAVNHLIIHAQIAPDSIPGFRSVLSDAATSSGARATLFQRERPIPYARFVAGAEQADFNEAIAAVLDRRFPIDRAVLLDSASSANDPPMADTSTGATTRIVFDDWVPGAMRMVIEGGAPLAGYVVVSENHYPDWRATVDGRFARTMRGNGTLITVPVDSGVRTVELRFESAEYRVGRMISIACLVVALAGCAVPITMRRGTNRRSINEVPV